MCGINSHTRVYKRILLQYKQIIVELIRFDRKHTFEKRTKAIYV